MGNIYNRNHHRRRRRMRRSQERLYVTFSLVVQDPIVVCLTNVWSDHKPSETTLQLIFHIDIKNFINKLSNFEEANWMGPDLKIHPAFKALSVGIRRYYYFIRFPESAASVDVWYLELMGSTTVSGIRNQLVKEICIELFQNSTLKIHFF